MRALKIPQQITRRDTESFEKYLQEVSKLSGTECLTQEQEVELARKIKKGDKKAEEELVTKNLKFVVSVAKQYQQDNCLLGDLVNEGNIGLIKAARKFDEKRGIKFISFAVWWIRQSIMCYLNDNSRTIRLPINRIGQLNKIKKFEQRFEQEYQRKPTSEEIVENFESEISTEDLSNVIMIEKGAKSISAEMMGDGQGEQFTLEEFIFDKTQKLPDEVMDASDLKVVVNSMMTKIPPKYKTVMEMHYGLNGETIKSFDEIAVALNLSKERVRQINKYCINFLKTKKNLKVVSPYLK